MKKNPRVKNCLRLMSCAVLLAGGVANGQTQDTVITFAYDPGGNVIQIKDALGNVTDQKYDALDRMYQQTLPAPGAGLARPVVKYGYDGLGQLESVQDPRTLSTTYTVDGLGNQTVIKSPDTGTTTKTYDAAGNLRTTLDAKSHKTTYDYDELNRVKTITYHDNSTTIFTYDQGTNGIGRLTQIADANSTTSYAYDQMGRLRKETRTIANVDYVTSYNYDSYGHLSSMTYPSTRQLNYVLDAMGRVEQIDTTRDGVTKILVRNVTYHPFGGVKSFVNGAGVTVTRTIDLDGRISAYTLASSLQAVRYDAASQVKTITDSTSSAVPQIYGYDGLSRLTSYSGSGASQTLTYDATGNRTSKTVGSAVSNYTIDLNSNRLSQISGATTQTYLYDPNGSTKNNGVATFGYDNRGRLTSVTTGQGTVTYRINAQGQRIQKAAGGATTVFHYDSAGRLIGERTGTAEKEYVYLNDIPVALLQ